MLFSKHDLPISSIKLDIFKKCNLNQCQLKNQMTFQTVSNQFDCFLKALLSGSIMNRILCNGGGLGLVAFGVRQRSYGLTRGMQSRMIHYSRRRLAGSATGPRPKEYGGFRPPHVDPTIEIAAEVMMTLTWLWIFWRAKHDLVYMLGIKKPWDDLHEHEDDHSDHH